jgi:Lectin C-type domain
MRWVALVLVGCGFSPTKVPNTAFGDGGVVDAAVGSGGMPPACLANNAYMPRSGSTHLYKRTTDSPKFDDAVEECQQDGAYLVHVDDTIENVYIVTTYGSTWVGASDQETEGTFREVSDNQVASYNNFIAPEPNDSNSDEDCVEIKSDGSWNDTGCDDTSHKALCECDPDYQAPPVPMCRSMQGAKTQESRMYFIHATPATWAAAKADCASTGAYLVVPSDDKENSWIQGSEIHVNADAWLGASQTGSVWSWTDQSPYIYSNWNSPPATMDECGVIRSNGKWDPNDCGGSFAYVCECPP